MGTLEGLHYKEGIWNAMSKVQKSEVIWLHRNRLAQRSVQAATTSGTNVPMSDVSDSIVRPTRAVESLETSREGNGVRMSATQDSANAGTTPSWGAQVACVAPISLVRTADAAQVDCSDPVGLRLHA